MGCLHYNTNKFTFPPLFYKMKKLLACYVKIQGCNYFLVCKPRGLEFTPNETTGVIKAMFRMHHKIEFFYSVYLDESFEGHLFSIDAPRIGVRDVCEELDLDAYAIMDTR